MPRASGGGVVASATTGRASGQRATHGGAATVGVASGTASPRNGASSGRARRAGQALLVLAVLAAVVFQGWDQIRDIDFSRVRLGWLPLLLACEVSSGVALVAGQAVLLGCGRWVRSPGNRPDGPGPVVLARTTLMATGLSYVLPGGPALSAAYAARRYRRFGISSSVAAQSQVATAAAAGMALGAVALVGVVVPGAARQAELDGRVHAVLVVAAAGVLMVGLGLALLVRSARSRRWLAQSRAVSWVTGCPPPQVGADQPPVLALRRTAAAAVCTAGSILLDVGCLAGSLAAVGVNIPWTSLLLAYGAAQLLALIPVTPGGAGFLEGGLAALLVVPHAANGAVALAVLVYRGFSWGLWVLGGGLALLHLRSVSPAPATGLTDTAAA